MTVFPLCKSTYDNVNAVVWSPEHRCVIEMCISPAYPFRSTNTLGENVTPNRTDCVQSICSLTIFIPMVPTHNSTFDSSDWSLPLAKEPPVR